MKLVQPLIFLFFAISAIAEDKPAKIQGAFGLKLGETVPKELIDSSSKNFLGFEEVIFNPKNPMPPLNKYVAKLTPNEKKIWMLVGSIDISKEEDFHHFTQQFRKHISSKYGEMKPRGDNGPTAEQWSYFEPPPENRMIMIRYSKFHEKLFLGYVDLTLHEQAEKELLEKKIEALDD